MVIYVFINNIRMIYNTHEICENYEMHEEYKSYRINESIIRRIIPELSSLENKTCFIDLTV